MIKRSLHQSDWLLIAANLLPVHGVWFLGWKPGEVFLVYCLETIIIGWITLLKLGIATATRRRDWWENNGSRTLMSGFFFMFFFLLHYGFFVAVQLTLFLPFVSFEGARPSNVLDLLLHPDRFLNASAWTMLAVIASGYLLHQLSGFVMRREYRTRSFMRIMFEPYLRIFVQQFVVILGGLLLAISNEVFILVFAGIKIFFTVFVRWEEALDATQNGSKINGSAGVRIPEAGVRD